MCLKEFCSCWSPPYEHEREGHDGSPDIRRYNDDAILKLKPGDDPLKKIHEVNHSNDAAPNLKPEDDPPKKIHEANHSDEEVSSNSPSKFGKGGHFEPSPQPTKTSEIRKNGKKITSAAAPKTTISTDALSEDSAPKTDSTQSANIYSQEADQKNPVKFTESIEQQPKEKIDHEDIASTARSRDSYTVETKANVEKNSFW